MQSFVYKGCVIYTDGRVYSNYELIGTYKTVSAAKAAATREDNRRKDFYSKGKKVG